MKIMVISTLYPPDQMGGAEKSVSLIAGGLTARGHDVSVLTLHGKPTETETIQAGVTVLRRPLHNIYWPFPNDDRRSALPKLAFHAIDSYNPAMARTVAAAMRSHRPDIVLTNQLSCFSTAAWQAIHAAGVPTLHSLRDFYAICPKSTMFRGDKPCVGQCVDCRILALPRKRMSQYVDGITGVSQYMIDRLRSYGLFRNALMVPAIISAVKTPPAISARVATPPEAVRHFGYIGRVEQEKGIDLLLDALVQRPPERWRLSIAGIGSADYRRHLDTRCAGLPVTFLGYVPDTQFYEAVDVVVVPSIWEEPLPRTVLEAFGYGLTVIASDRGGIPEVVHHHETGYLVDLDQPQQMLEAVTRAIDDPLEGRPYGLAGRRIAVARTEAAVAAEYEAASLAVLQHARSRRLPPNAASPVGPGDEAATAA